ncbi:MAG: chorismate synthase, partial [Acidimicrobiales bacterium]
MSSTWGQSFRIQTFGESHGGGVGVVVDGCPPRLPLHIDEIQRDLNRRRPGQSHLVTQRDEADSVQILSGVFEGYSLGTPIALLVSNRDARPSAYDDMKNLFRPSHADYTTEAKYGIRDWQGGGRASARETVGRVAAGAIARKLIAEAAGIEVLGWVSRAHKVDARVDPATVTFDQVEASPTRCPVPAAATAIGEAIEVARNGG